MFTGLIETLGTVKGVEPDGPGKRLVIAADLAASLGLGESVAINGVCLTVTKREERTFEVQAGPETLMRTNLGELATGDMVNLERSVRVGDRLGGHIVQGHVDGIGTIASRQQTGEWELFTFKCPPELAAQMVSKGSVAVDGISLTVVEVTRDSFSVALIPHTLAVTTLGGKSPGATVNLETDLFAKYVWKYMQAFGQTGTERQR